MIGIIIGLGIIIVLVVLIIVKRKRNSYNEYSDLEGRLSGIRNGFDACCAKIGKFFGV